MIKHINRELINISFSARLYITFLHTNVFSMLFTFPKFSIKKLGQLCNKKILKINMFPLSFLIIIPNSPQNKTQNKKSGNNFAHITNK